MRGGLRRLHHSGTYGLRLPSCLASNHLWNYFRDIEGGVAASGKILTSIEGFVVRILHIHCPRRALLRSKTLVGERHALVMARVDLLHRSMRESSHGSHRR